ncbi:MAG: TIGR03943 family protein [Bacillus sp. (in: firmicutes)]
MNFIFQQALRALLLLVFSGLLFKLNYTGDITKFINPKYVGLSVVASILFFLLAAIQITRLLFSKESNHDCHQENQICNHDHGNSSFHTKKLVSYMVIAFPLITGFFLPAKFLDASIAEKKGGTAILSNQQKKNTEDSLSQAKANTNSSTTNAVDNNPIDPGLANQKTISSDEFEKINHQLDQSDYINMQEKVFSTYYEKINMEIDAFAGRTIKLKGFVYKEEGLAKNQLVLSRFVITHCIADAGIIGFLSEFPEAEKITEDTWLEATGILEKTAYNGANLPMLKITSWKRVNEPEQPYVYPLDVK